MNNTTTIKELVSLATICNIPTTTLAKAAGLSAQNFNNKLKGLSTFTIIHSEAIEAKLLEVREALNAHFNINHNQDVYGDKQNNVYDDKQPAAAPIENDGYVPASTIYAEFEAAREADPNSFREDSNGRIDISYLFKHKKAAPPTTEEISTTTEEDQLDSFEKNQIVRGVTTRAQILEDRKFDKNPPIKEEQLPY